MFGNEGKIAKVSFIFFLREIGKRYNFFYNSMLTFLFHSLKNFVLVKNDTNFFQTQVIVSNIDMGNNLYDIYVQINW